MRRLVAYPPAAIILDFDPEQEQGWGTWRALKRNPVTQEIPILFYRQFQEAGRGAVFELDYLSKPLNQNRLAQALGRYGLTSGDAPDGKIILIVDDEQNTLDLHAALVHSQLPDSRILFARDGLQALEAMKQCLPDLVLLDLMMPVMDGFTVLENMRRSEAARGVPVIVLTSHHLTETEMERLNQGVAAVMEKGLFRADETLSKIEAVLARNKSLGSEARRIARRAMAYIHEHYAENITRKVLAAHVGVSEAYLSTCFRREIGVSPTTYVERYRIKQAKALLETTQQSITQVALEVGFCDSSYFGRVFHKEVGVSPNAYRRQGNRI